MRRTPVKTRSPEERRGPTRPRLRFLGRRLVPSMPSFGFCARRWEPPYGGPMRRRDVYDRPRIWTAPHDATVAAIKELEQRMTRFEEISIDELVRRRDEREVGQ